MKNEREGPPIPLTAIHINLKDRTITFEAEEGPVANLSLAPEGIFFQTSASPPAATVPTEHALPDSIEMPANTEKERTITLTGKLKSQPREGKPDRRGNPTATARFAVHEEGEELARLYYASFHRHTARIALTLPKEAQITVQGYAHPSGDPTGKRLDTFSVINIPHYPGKPVKG